MATQFDHKRLTVFSRLIFGSLSVFMMLLAAGLVLYSAYQLASVAMASEPEIGRLLLESVGYAIIAIAVFEVAKFIFEEEVVSPTELRHTGEARRSLTKFLSTIAIAVFLEALVSIFETSKGGRLEQMLYPTLLLLGGVALIVGLGVFQWLSAQAEKAARGAPGEPSNEDDLKQPGTAD